MNLPFLLGYGSLEIEERRPRSANEPRVKRLSFAKNRRHVTDDMYRGRRGSSGNWAMVPYDGGQRRQNQIEEWDRRKAAAQLRFDEQEFRRQERLNTLQLQQDEERHRRRTLEARQLNDIILRGQQIPPHYWQQMQDMQRQDMQRRQDMERMHRQVHEGGHGGGHGVPPAPPHHGHPEGGGDHGGQRPRIMRIAPGDGRGGGPAEPPFGDHGADEFDHERHHDNGERGRSRSARRGHHDNVAHGGGHHGHRGHGHQENEIEIIESDSEDDDRPPLRIVGLREQPLPRVFRRPHRSRSRAHRSHSRPRNHSRMSSRRRPSRPRRYYYSDDSDSESEYEHVRIIRPRSRGSLTRGRGQSRHYEDSSSDDSFVHYTPRARFRLSSKTRRRSSRH